MKIHVRLIQKDLLNQETKVAADGIGLLNGGHLLYQETGTKAKHAVTFSENEIVLERAAEISSRTVLCPTSEGSCTVHSPYGDMQFMTRLSSFARTDEKWTVHYSIYTEDGQVSEMELIWEFERLA